MDSFYSFLTQTFNDTYPNLATVQATIFKLIPGITTDNVTYQTPYEVTFTNFSYNAFARNRTTYGIYSKWFSTKSKTNQWLTRSSTTKSTKPGLNKTRQTTLKSTTTKSTTTQSSLKSTTGRSGKSTSTETSFKSTAGTSAKSTKSESTVISTTATSAKPTTRESSWKSTSGTSAKSSTNYSTLKSTSGTSAMSTTSESNLKSTAGSSAKSTTSESTGKSTLGTSVKSTTTHPTLKSTKDTSVGTTTFKSTLKTTTSKSTLKSTPETTKKTSKPTTVNTKVMQPSKSTKGKKIFKWNIPKIEGISNVPTPHRPAKPPKVKKFDIEKMGRQFYGKAKKNRFARNCFEKMLNAALVVMVEFGEAFDNCYIREEYAGPLRKIIRKVIVYIMKAINACRSIYGPAVGLRCAVATAAAIFDLLKEVVEIIPEIVFRKPKLMTDCLDKHIINIGCTVMVLIGDIGYCAYKTLTTVPSII